MHICNLLFIFVFQYINMDQKKMADLGIDELKGYRKSVLERKSFYEGLYRVIKTKIEDAKRLAHTEKKFLPPSQLRSLENKLKEHGDEVQKLQKLSGDINSEIKRKEAFIFERMFVDLCKAEMPADQWSRICEKIHFKILKG